MNKKIKIRDEEYELEERDRVLILVLQDLIHAIKGIKNG